MIARGRKRTAHGSYTTEYIGFQTGHGVPAGLRVFGSVNGNFDEKLRGSFPWFQLGTSITNGPKPSFTSRQSPNFTSHWVKTYLHIQM